MTARRNLLACAAGAIVAGSGLPADANAPDSDLLSACADFDALERAYRATDFAAAPGTSADDEAEAQRDRILAVQDPILDRICAHPPTTLAGAIAIARSLALWDAELFNDALPGGYTNARLIGTLVAGLLGRPLE